MEPLEIERVEQAVAGTGWEVVDGKDVPRRGPVAYQGKGRLQRSTMGHNATTAGGVPISVSAYVGAVPWNIDLQPGMVVQVEASELDALGMVIDIADLKAMVHEVLSPFDHRVINDIPPFDVRNTTAELVSEFAFEEVDRRLRRFDGGRVRLRRVEVWENDSACAIYEP